MNKKSDTNNSNETQKNNNIIDQNFLKELEYRIKKYEVETNNNLVSIGNEQNSEATLIKELNQRVNLFGMEHPYTVHVFNVLGRLYSDEKNFSGMVNLLRSSLRSRIKELGIHHPETLFTMNKLGRKLAACKEYEEAEYLFRRSLDGLKEKFNDNHSIIRRCQNDLNLVLSIRRRRLNQPKKNLNTL